MGSHLEGFVNPERLLGTDEAWSWLELFSEGDGLLMRLSRGITNTRLNNLSISERTQRILNHNLKVIATMIAIASPVTSLQTTATKQRTETRPVSYRTISPGSSLPSGKDNLSTLTDVLALTILCTIVPSSNRKV